MKRKLSSLALALALASSLASIVATQGALVQAQQPPPAAPPPPAIVGAWLMTDVGGTPMGAAVFGSDGELMITNPAGIVGTGHGKWTKKTEQEFSYTLVVLPNNGIVEWATGAQESQLLPVHASLVGGRAFRARGNLTTGPDNWMSDRPIIEEFDAGGWVRGNLGPIRLALRAQ